MSRSAAHDSRNNSLRAAFATPFVTAKLAAPTAKVIEDYARAHKLEHHCEEIRDSHGARLHWLGDRSATKTLLYFHGGGFAFPAFEGHLLFLGKCLEYVSAKGKSMAVAILEYSLTRENKYPVQIIQATEALRCVLSKGHHPSDVILGGDSAGANLALAVLSVVRQSIEGSRPLALGSPLGGLLLISPWVSFDTETQSWKDNLASDIITAECVHELAAGYLLLPAERNSWSEPYLAPASWWEAMPTNRILNIYGSFEVFRDHISEFGRRLETAGNRVENIECPLHIHIDCVLDAQAHMEAGPMATKIWEWLVEVL